MRRINRKNYQREKIFRENLLPYLDIISSEKFSDRNKDIIRDYTSGISKVNLAQKYSLSPGRIDAIIKQFMYHCRKQNTIHNKH